MSSGRNRPVTAHTRLLAQYVAEVRETLDGIRDDPAAGRIRWGQTGAFSRIAARKADEDSRRLSTHPKIIALIRKYFFACEKLNKERPPDEFVLPTVFAVELLSGAGNDLFDVFTDLPYIPIGVDDNDRYL